MMMMAYKFLGWAAGEQGIFFIFIIFEEEEEEEEEVEWN